MRARQYRTVKGPPIYGLTFLANDAAGSAVRLVWTGANFLSRTSHTVIWKAKYYQQTGYYAVVWHDTGNPTTFQGNNYEFGTHPYPAADGTVDGTGQALTGSGNVGTVHFWELAGLVGHDYLCTAGGGGGTNISSYLGSFVSQARTCEVVSGTTLRHKYYWDLSDTSKVITQDINLSQLESPSSPDFYFGSSQWRDGHGAAGTGSTDESPGCTLRFMKLFNAPLVAADIVSEAAFNSNSATTSAGISALWYSNINPTPTDVADKSGAGHNPSWANANRPTLYAG